MPDSVREALISDLWSLIPTMVYFVVGAIMFGVSIWIMAAIAPFSVTKEIEEDQNTSLGIIMAGVLIGLSIIMAAVIRS